MKQQVLSPAVQDGEHTDVGAEPLRITCDFDQRLGCGREQQIVELSRTGQRKDVELMRYGEHDVEVAGGKQFLLSCLEPVLAGPCLTLGAMSIAAGVEGDAGFKATLGTHVEVSAQRGGATGEHGAEHLQLLIAGRVLITFEEPAALGTED